MSRNKNRTVNTHFWSDNYVLDLDPTEKLIFNYLITNDQTNMLGVYEIALRKISFETGIDSHTVKKILDRFKRDNKAEYIEGYVLLYNFSKHQKFNPNMIKSAKEDAKMLPDTVKASKGFQRVRKAFKESAKEEIESEREIEKEIEVEKEKPAVPATQKLKNKLEHPLQIWIEENAPRVNKMKDPLTAEQCDLLLSKYDNRLVAEIILAMHNYEPLHKKSRSANLTIQNWIKREQKNENNRQQANRPKNNGQAFEQAFIKAREEAIYKQTNGIEDGEDEWDRIMRS